jgi:hypothetical protein
MSNDQLVVSIQQVEIKGKRFYKATFQDGSFRLLRSVTSVCKGARIPSYLDVWEKEQVEALGIAGFDAAMNQAALDGTLLHKIIEDHCDGKHYPILDPEIKTKFEGYLRWEEKNKPETIWQEKTLYSLKHGYAGRADRKAFVDGRTAIIDYKSAKAARTDHKEQGAAYIMADSEMKPEVHADSVLILALGAENKQGYSETWLDTPYEITKHFMGFSLKNQLVNYYN